MNYPNVMSTPEIERLFPGVYALPTTFILDRDGKLAQKHIGLLNASLTELETRIARRPRTRTSRSSTPTKKTRSASPNAAQANKIPGIDLSQPVGREARRSPQGAQHRALHLRLRPDPRPVPPRRSRLRRQPAGRPGAGEEDRFAIGSTQLELARPKDSDSEAQNSESSFEPASCDSNYLALQSTPMRTTSLAIALSVSMFATDAAAQGRGGGGGQQGSAAVQTIDARTAGLQKIDGYMPLYWDDKTGTLVDGDQQVRHRTALLHGPDDGPRVERHRARSRPVRPGTGRQVPAHRAARDDGAAELHLARQQPEPRRAARRRGRVREVDPLGLRRSAPRPTAACWWTPPTSSCATSSTSSRGCGRELPRRPHAQRDRRAVDEGVPEEHRDRRRC